MDAPRHSDGQGEAYECPDLLSIARRGGSETNRFIVPTEEQRAAFVELASVLVAEGEGARLRTSAMAEALGFELRDVPGWPGVVIVREVSTARRGGGAYLFRLDRRNSLVVQAPHTFFDEGTLPLSCELFVRARAAVLFIDTAHRYKAAEADADGEFPADMAHSTKSFFQAATEGTLRKLTGATVVQLHGFGERAAPFNVVLSNGERVAADPLVVRAEQALSGVVPTGIVRFPDEIDELGATTNVQGPLVRRYRGRFLHVEMAAKLRRELLATARLRGLFLDALTSALEQP